MPTFRRSYQPAISPMPLTFQPVVCHKESGLECID
jgi:hypothetical protein